jgi:hypothetical protein
MGICADLELIVSLDDSNRHDECHHHPELDRFIPKSLKSFIYDFELEYYVLETFYPNAGPDHGLYITSQFFRDDRQWIQLSDGNEIPADRIPIMMHKERCFYTKTLRHLGGKSTFVKDIFTRYNAKEARNELPSVFYGQEVLEIIDFEANPDIDRKEIEALVAEYGDRASCSTVNIY